MESKLNILIIGFGSIGRNYGEYIKNTYKYHTVNVVDPSIHSKDFALKNGFNYYSDLKDALKDLKKIDYGIVSNWGPDHLVTTDQLIDAAIKRITVEKPFCNDIQLGLKIKKKLILNDVKCHFHYRWPYLKLDKLIFDLSKKYNLVYPCSIFVSGGSGGLSTGGVHWMDFARRIFFSEPKDVLAKLNIDRINPRSSDLIYIDGTSIFTFEDNKRLSFCLDNNSSIAIKTKILFKHGQITIDGKSVLRIYKRKDSEIEIAEKQITRYGIPELLDQSFEFEGKSTVGKVVDEMISDSKNNIVCCDAESGLIASSMLIGALESSQSGCIYNFKILSDIKCSKDWLFS